MGEEKPTNFQYQPAISIPVEELKPEEEAILAEISNDIQKEEEIEEVLDKKIEAEHKKLDVLEEVRDAHEDVKVQKIAEYNQLVNAIEYALEVKKDGKVKVLYYLINLIFLKPFL